MTEKIKMFYDALKRKDYRLARRPLPLDPDASHDRGDEGYMEYLRTILEQSRPLFLDGDEIGFHQSFNKIGRAWANGNYTPDYARIITDGFDETIRRIRESRKHAETEKQKQLADDMIECLVLTADFAEKYRLAAKETGRDRLAAALERIPHKGAETFYEFCVFFKICIFLLRASRTNHVTLGRFDQYAYPFYEADRRRGVSKEELFETLEELFLSLNVDSDIYKGVQTGDNGQSMVLAGFDEQGNYLFNELSDLCLEASRELKLIDPKINLRVGKNTPLEVYIKGTRLTKEGLGFPQYSNDDVVIPGLIALGYAPEDARNYAVAACWEFTIPNCAADRPNLCTMDFPKVVSDAVHEKLTESPDFETLMGHVRRAIEAQCDEIAKTHSNTWGRSLPVDSLFTDGCIESLVGTYDGGSKYHNYGCHGAGISNAADALAAIKKTVYEEKSVTAKELLRALDENFQGHEELRNRLRACPKMGNNDDYVDSVACELMDAFSTSLNGRPNDIGGVFRAGTGSAMEYLRKGKLCPATADGRLAGQPYASSFSPSLDVKTTGLLSVIQSFTKFPLERIINGGPLTIEIHDTVFRNEIGVEKTAELVRQFILLGGHQLQLNAVNRERLLDAQKHPENYPDLIVRVWGWSGYFNELDKEYQDHIIRRLEYQA